MKDIDRQAINSLEIIEEPNQSGVDPNREATVLGRLNDRLSPRAKAIIVASVAIPVAIYVLGAGPYNS